jgi:hypothetical protein
LTYLETEFMGRKLQSRILGAATRMVVLAAAVASSSAWAQAQTVVIDETRTIGQTNTAIERDFDVATAGEYEIRFSDLQVPAPLSNYRVAVTRGADVVATIESPATTRRFAATVGSYGVRVIGAPGAQSTFATVGLRIVNVATNAPVLDLSNVLQNVVPPPPATQKTLDTTFEVTAAGRYELALADLQFPVALNQVTAAVIREGAPQVSANLTAPGTAAFDATPGVYRVVAVGTAASTRAAGLFSVRVRPAAGGAARFSQVIDLGDVARIGASVLDAQSHTLVVTDFAVPAALASTSSVVVADGAVVATLAAPGSVAFNAVAIEHTVFTLGSSAGASGGSYGVELRRGATAVVAGSRTVAAGANGVSFAFTADVTAAGRYALRLTDFAFSQAFTSLRAIAVQGGTSSGTVNAGTTPSEFDLQTGRVSLLVFGQLNAGTTGLFGLNLVSTAAGARPVIDLTQGAGALFDARRVEISTPGRYEAIATDLGFPVNFANLDVQISRGTEVVGTFFAGGTFIFNVATPGTYFVNFIARPGATGGGYGTYRLRVATAAPAPTVTLTAESTTVTTGSPARLRWTSTNATSCTASNAWAGSKPTAGEEATAAISAASVFQLACTGPGGTTSAQVSIAVSAPDNSGGGGGGSLPWSFLIGLGALVALQWRRQRLPARGIR